MMKRHIKIIASLLALGAMIYGMIPVALAQTAVNVTNAAGSTLSFTAPSNIYLTAVTTSQATASTTGSLTGEEIRDYRGSGAGWTLTLTSTNMGLFATNTKIRVVQGTAVIANATLGSSGAYTGANATNSFTSQGAVTAGRFVIHITSVVSGSISEMDLYYPNGQVSSAATAAPTLCSTAGYDTIGVATAGLSFCLADGRSWVDDDEISFETDMFPYTVITVEQSTLTGSGGSDGVGIATLATGGYRFSGTATTATTSSANTIFNASTNNGMGYYSFTETPTMIRHGNSLTGVYTATGVWTIASN